MFALGENDLREIVFWYRSNQGEDSVPEKSLVHDPGAGSETKGQITKTMKFSSPKGFKQGGMINMTMTTKGDSKEPQKISIGLSGAELYGLILHLEYLFVRAAGWETEVLAAVNASKTSPTA